MIGDSKWNKYELCRISVLLFIVYIFCSHQLTVVGKLVSSMTENNAAVEIVLLYCMKQMSNLLTSGCEAECNEELVLTPMLTVLKVNHLKF